jgi:hypothetical protein
MPDIVVNIHHHTTTFDERFDPRYPLGQKKNLSSPNFATEKAI